MESSTNSKFRPLVYLCMYCSRNQLQRSCRERNKMMQDSVFWVQVASLCYASLSAPLYMFVIASLLYYRKKVIHLNNSFFQLWLSLGMADLGHVGIFWFSAKLPLMGFFDAFYLRAGKTFAIFVMYLTFVTHFSQVLGIVMLSVNRFTALLYPTRSEQVGTYSYRSH